MQSFDEADFEEAMINKVNWCDIEEAAANGVSRKVFKKEKEGGVQMKTKYIFDWKISCNSNLTKVSTTDVTIKDYSGANSLV